MFNLLNAWSFAENRNTPLDLHIIVHWAGIDLIAGRSILTAQSRFLDRLSRWFHKRSKPLAYLWTMECQPRKGLHTHLLVSGKQLHAAALRDLGRGLPKLLTGNDAKLQRGVIELAFNKIPLPYDPTRSGYRAVTYEQRRGEVAYICKGLHPRAATAVGINPEQQNEIGFRRCGVSRSLDWAARRRAGWVEYPLEHFDFEDLAEKRRNGIASTLHRHARAPGAASASRLAILGTVRARAPTRLSTPSGELSEA